MEDTYLAEHDNRDATTLSIADLGPKLAKEAFDVREQARTLWRPYL